MTTAAGTWRRVVSAIRRGTPSTTTILGKAEKAKADSIRLGQQFRQLGDVGGHAPRLIARVRPRGPVELVTRFGDHPAMGFNRRKMEDERQQVAEKAAAARRATDAQVLEDAERLIDVWNERQAKRMPLLYSPTIGAAITARYWFLGVRCPACRTTQALDLRTLDRHRDAAVTSLIPALSCRSCRPNAPFAEIGFKFVRSTFAR